MAEVLIVGAGPTGLVLALALSRRKVPIRLIEKNSGPGQASRAMAVQARTLEFYQQFGFADEVVRRGFQMDRFRIWEGTRQVAMIEFGDLGKGLSPFPFALSFPQDEHEKLLVEKVRALGVEVEWNTELVSFAEDGSGVRAVLRKNGSEETCHVTYLCGCDGARSTVREQLKIGFPGGTYDHRFYVADVSASGVAVSNPDINGCLGERGFSVVFPIRTSGQHRLIGVVPDELADRETLTFEDIRPSAESLIGIKVQSVNWFSSYHVHHRVADRFRAGRVFIAGDAGHVHSPVGGQGMNTGIGDAFNLAWKLAAVLHGKSDPSILDTYESERIAFARLLVRTTDEAFQVVVGRGFGSYLIRDLLFPRVVPLVQRSRRLRRAQFRLISQIRIQYRESALNQGRVGNLHAGDRLPWVESAGNFAPLASMDWQVHVYGEAREQLRSYTSLPVHEFGWNADCEKAGLTRDAMYLIRPDGYVALASAVQDVAELVRYVGKWRIEPLAG